MRAPIRWVSHLVTRSVIQYLATKLLQYQVELQGLGVVARDLGCFVTLELNDADRLFKVLDRLGWLLTQLICKSAEVVSVSRTISVHVSYLVGWLVGWIRVSRTLRRFDDRSDHEA